MANKPLGMHKIRQLLLFLGRGLSQRSIEKELHISRKTIGVYHQRFRDTGLEISALLKLQDEQLEQILGLLDKVRTSLLLILERYRDLEVKAKYSEESAKRKINFTDDSQGNHILPSGKIYK